MIYIIKWFVLTFGLYMAYNWFVVPSYPAVKEYMEHLDLTYSAGASAVVVMLILFFGKSK